MAIKFGRENDEVADAGLDESCRSLTCCAGKTSASRAQSYKLPAANLPHSCLMPSFAAKPASMDSRPTGTPLVQRSHKPARVSSPNPANSELWLATTESRQCSRYIPCLSITATAGRSILPATSRPVSLRISSVHGPAPLTESHLFQLAAISAIPIIAMTGQLRSVVRAMQIHALPEVNSQVRLRVQNANALTRTALACISCTLYLNRQANSDQSECTCLPGYGATEPFPCEPCSATTYQDGDGTSTFAFPVAIFYGLD